jgi:hypothetical protein
LAQTRLGQPMLAHWSERAWAPTSGPQRVRLSGSTWVPQTSAGDRRWQMLGQCTTHSRLWLVCCSISNPRCAYTQRPRHTPTTRSSTMLTEALSPCTSVRGRPSRCRQQSRCKSLPQESTARCARTRLIPTETHHRLHSCCHPPRTLLNDCTAKQNQGPLWRFGKARLCGLPTQSRWWLQYPRRCAMCPNCRDRRALRRRNTLARCDSERPRRRSARWPSCSSHRHRRHETPSRTSAALGAGVVPWVGVLVLGWARPCRGL